MEILGSRVVILRLSMNGEVLLLDWQVGGGFWHSTLSERTGALGMFEILGGGCV